jgi:carbonic anhydrase/acetyltransferase-like protein (isoleucine patch superfamily)
MPGLSFHGRTPAVPPSAFLAGGAYLIGDVTLGEDASVWFTAVLRGDINSITVGARTNIQDGAVVHVTHELPAVIGNDVTVGHRAIVHACTVGDGSLVGMGSVVLDGAVIGPSCLIAAGAVVLQGARIPAGSLVAGVPGRVLRPLTEEEKRQLLDSALHYVEYARAFR